MVNFWTSSRPLTLCCALLALAACCPCPPPAILTLDRAQAARQEQVTAEVRFAGEVQVTVGGAPAQVVSRTPQGLVFAVPEGTPAGPQEVSVRAGTQFATARLVVLGDDVRPDEATVLFAGVQDEAALQARLRAVNPAFSLLRLRPLAGSDPASPDPDSPCAGSLAEIDVGGVPLGLALEQLRALPEALHIDPASDYDVRALDPLGAIGARAAHSGRGLLGAGVLVAVLDTGVGEHPDLAGRVRFDLALNALDGSADVSDGYALDSLGHGTPAAVLAAGGTLGVAPAAEVLPVKVCDDGGACLSSDVVVGTCHALAAAADEGRLGRLVLNYSLGGETEVGAITAVLRYALEQNVLVAAAGGNRGDPRQFPQPAPRQHPAASSLEGLVAVAALSSGPPAACLTFESVPPLSLETSFPVGQGFSEAGASVVMEPFTFGSGATFADGFAYTEPGGAAGGTGLHLWTNNVLADFDFGGEVGGLALRFGDYGGTVNLRVNGTLLTLPTLSDAPLEVAGVRLEVSGPGAAGQGPGELRLLGPLADIALGGQEFALDDVCPLAGAEADWRPAVFSTQGDYLDVAAPGEGITSGTPAGGLATYAGTSFATPLVAGALALWREAEPSATPADIEARLKAAARPLPYPARAVGAGMLGLFEQP